MDTFLPIFLPTQASNLAVSVIVLVLWLNVDTDLVKVTDFYCRLS
jgi:hypothetical protein